MWEALRPEEKEEFIHLDKSNIYWADHEDFVTKCYGNSFRINPESENGDLYYGNLELLTHSSLESIVNEILEERRWSEHCQN